jgi:hypothetical protein
MGNVRVMRLSMLLRPQNSIVATLKGLQPRLEPP